MKLSSVLSGCLAFGPLTVSAAPQSGLFSSPTENIESRGLLKGVIPGLDGVVDGVVDGIVVNLVKGLLGQIHNAIEAGDRDGILNAVKKLVPTATPTSVEGAHKVIEAVAKAKHTNILEYSSHLIANGIISGSVGDLLQYAQGVNSDKNGYANS
jgi:hypothetical protein